MAKPVDDQYWDRVKNINKILPKYKKAIFILFYPSFKNWEEWNAFVAGKKNEQILEMLERIIKNLDKFRKLNT